MIRFPAPSSSKAPMSYRVKLSLMTELIVASTETPPALTVRRGGEPWRKVRLDQDRRVNTAVPHVARPQTLAEQRLLFVGALRLEQRAEVPEDRAVVHVPAQLLGPRLVHLQEGNDLGQVEAVWVRMLRCEPAVGQGENG